MIFGRNLYGGKKRLHSTSLAVNCVQSSVSIRCCNETFCLIITFCFSGINRSFTSIHSFRQFQLIYILNNLHGSRTIAQPFSYSNSIKRWLMTVIIIWTCMFWRRLTFMLVACMKLFGIRICWNYLTFEFIWLRLVYLIKMCTVLSSASWILQSLHFSNNNSFALSCDKKNCEPVYGCRVQSKRLIFIGLWLAFFPIDLIFPFAIEFSRRIRLKIDK